MLCSSIESPCPTITTTTDDLGQPSDLIEDELVKDDDMPPGGAGGPAGRGQDLPGPASTGALLLNTSPDLLQGLPPTQLSVSQVKFHLKHSK